MSPPSLNVGQYISWPTKACYLRQGELAVVAETIGKEGILLQRRGLLSFKAGDTIPVLSLKQTSLKLQLKAVTTCILEEIDPINLEANIDKIWHIIIYRLIQQNLDIKTQQITAKSQTLDKPSENDFLWFVNNLMSAHLDQNKEKIQQSNLIDDRSERRLFLSFEEGSSTETNSEGQLDSISIIHHQNDALLSGLELIAKRLNRSLKYSSYEPKDSRQRLISILDRSGFIHREILLNEMSLDKDCGHLIGFQDDNDQSPIVLLAESSGYQVWQPAVMQKPLPIKECNHILNQLNPRMINVFPGFIEEDLTTVGLLKFAYGKPQQTEKFIIGGLLTGLAIGFLLSIGKDVGAARWIFGMGATGLFMGGTLGVLSGGFRTATAVVLASTLLGLLTPTFNTIGVNQALPDKDFGLLLQISGILSVAGLTRVTFEWTKSRSLQIAQQRGAVRSQFAAMNRMLSLSTDFFRKYTFGDIQLRFSALEQLRNEIQTLLEGGLLRTTLTSIYILFMLRISVKLTVLAIVVALMLMIPTAIVGLQSRELARKQQIVAGAAQTRNLELISSVSKLRMAGAESAAAHWWGESFRRITTLEQLRDAKDAISTLLQTIIPNLGNLLLYIVITKLASEALQNPNISSPNIGQLLGFFSAFGTFIGSMASLASLFVGAFDMPIIYERARPILEAKPEALDDLVDPGLLNGAVSLDRVSYRYESNQPLILDQVSITANPGEFIALVGPSGSGKSTIVRMLLGFGDPEEGTVRFDGQPLRGLRKDRIREQIGTVMQNSSIMAGSLFECIAGGSLISQEQAWKAAEQVAMADDIREMPMGMQTVLPEGGGTLSGGQRQRLCIARALVRNPKILIFDEATSALDNRTQMMVTESLQAMSITRVAVAHRLSTIRNADRIFVLQDGQIKQIGSFDQLISKEGLFAELMKRQVT
ncbi:putative ABC transporter ATP-binding protein [Prochlorococcus sp. MIT 1303]|nr:putative ABC transporter ATP-binding protein [Prochlorococcus sp. MIT 1303]